jgi:hypothetical protein
VRGEGGLDPASSPIFAAYSPITATQQDVAILPDGAGCIRTDAQRPEVPRKSRVGDVSDTAARSTRAVPSAVPTNCGRGTPYGGRSTRRRGPRGRRSAGRDQVAAFSPPRAAGGSALQTLVDGNRHHKRISGSETVLEVIEALTDPLVGAGAVPASRSAGRNGRTIGETLMRYGHSDSGHTPWRARLSNRGAARPGRWLSPSLLARARGPRPRRRTLTDARLKPSRYSAHGLAAAWTRS